MVPLWRTAVLTKKQLCVTLNLISRELVTTGADSGDRELVAYLFREESAAVRPSSSSMKWSLDPASTDRCSPPAETRRDVTARVLNCRRETPEVGSSHSSSPASTSFSREYYRRLPVGNIPSEMESEMSKGSVSFYFVDPLLSSSPSWPNTPVFFAGNPNFPFLLVLHLNNNWNSFVTHFLSQRLLLTTIKRLPSTANYFWARGIGEM